MLASKKGVAVTFTILAVATAASFLVWFIPQETPSKFVVTDFESNLDRVKEIHLSVGKSLENDFENLLNGKLSPQEYARYAESTSSDINSQIIQLVESSASEEWQESYVNYIEALRSYNSYIRETIVAANKLDEGYQSNEISDILEKIDQMKKNTETWIQSSDNSRP